MHSLEEKSFVIIANVGYLNVVFVHYDLELKEWVKVTIFACN